MSFKISNLLICFCSFDLSCPVFQDWNLRYIHENYSKQLEDDHFNEQVGMNEGRKEAECRYLPNKTGSVIKFDS